MLLKKRSTGSTPDLREIARDMIRRADAARDARRFAEAAVLYRESLRLVPGKAGIHVQAGHMFKETGNHQDAETHYREASALTPNDADLALQLGHFYKATGRLVEAERAYQRAIELKPRWDVPAVELKRLREAGWQPTSGASTAPAHPKDVFKEIDDLALAAERQGLAVEAAPQSPFKVLHAHSQGIELRRLGRRERTHWGVMPTVRGVEALRGYSISQTPILEVQLLLNGTLIYRGAPKGGYELTREHDNPDLRKYVFNVWFDFSNFLPGRYELEYRAIDLRQRTQTRHERVVIAPPLDPAQHESSDGVLPPGTNDGRTLDEQINARASMIRPSQRLLLKEAPRTVLVQRMDQLGDMVVSLPALRRLREILPEARLVGLLSRANADLAATLGVFDEIVTVDFPDDPSERRRVMPLATQEALRERLAPYAFDMAIDLSENVSSRPLLVLSGAPFLFGFPCGEMPALDIEMSGFTHDAWNGHETVPHTNKLVGMVNWLGAMLKKQSSIVRRDDLNPDRLAAFGLLKDDRYAVLHDGARLKFSRWPHYAELATRLIEQSDLKVVMLTDDSDLRANLPEALTASDRFQLIDGKLLFDDFDALLHWGAVFVGNDSGPKHLASLRGAPVVSLHMARNNWNEWGQENGGYIISRKVPCAGCLIWHDPEECGKDFACMKLIGVEEVLGAVWKLIR